MSAPTEVFFDDSLPLFAKAIADGFGDDVLERGLVVRDSSGRLRFLSPEAPPTGEKREQIEKEIVEALGAYSRRDGVLAFRDEPGVQLLLKDSGALPVRQDSLHFHLLDRRIIGSAWLDRPLESAAKPPRIVFASLKGGVGRSTALAIAASDLSRRNKNILVVDLDLEAPGVGHMLLNGDRLPRFGTVDYLVENGLGGVTERSLQDFVGTSPLTSPSGGRVDVVPALGKEAIEHPSNTLPKLARAMIEDINPKGTSISMTVKIAEMIRRFTARDQYDVILIDSRAGMSELAAPPILALGATVLLFGTAQQQTIEGYAGMFAAFNLLAERDREAGRRAEWRLLLKAVYSKAGQDELTAARYRDDLYDLFADNLYDADEELQGNAEAISFDIDDESAPHWPLVIPFAQSFVEFDPVRTPSQLTAPFYEQSYRQFLDGIDSLIAPNGVAPDATENAL